MNLPERAKPFLDRLEAFLVDPAVTHFGHAAREIFFGEEQPVVEAEELKDFLDYALFAHRDADGRSFTDHFLAARGGTMSSEEREALAGFSKSVYGIFLVEAARPGKGLTLRRGGTDERFEVVEVEASRALKPGMGVIARLVPYRGHHEITGTLRAVPPEAAYLSDRITSRYGDDAAKDLSNPLAIRKILGRVGARSSPPENQLEAEIHAAQVFAEVKFPLSVEETQRRFQTEASAVELLRKLPELGLEDKEAFDRFVSALTHLWNYTPRDDLGALSPTEKSAELRAIGRPELPPHLLEDLKNEIVAKVSAAEYPDDSSRRAAVLAVQARWYSTPQKELRGLSPRELVERPRWPAFPDGAELPPADAPIWTPERLQALLDSHRPASMLWAIRRIAPDPEVARGIDVLEAVAFLLSHEDESLVEQTLDSLQGLGTASQAPEIAAWIAQRLPSFVERNADLPVSALRALGGLRPAEHSAAFLAALGDDDPGIIEATIEGLAASRCAGAGEALLGFLDGATDANLAIASLVALCRLREAELAARAAELVIDRFAEDEGLDIEDIILDFAGQLVVGDCLYFAASGVLFVEEEEAVTAPVRLGLFHPTEDPAATRRGAEILPGRVGEQVLELADSRELEELIELVSRLAVEAFERAVLENRSFSRLGGTLAGVAKALGKPKVFAGLTSETLEQLSALAGALLAKAIRARDISSEIEAAGDDPAKMLELCRVDEAWLDANRIPRFARALQEDDLLPLVGSADPFVRATSRILLGAMDPEKHLGSFLDALDDWPGTFDPMVSGLLRAAGDRVLPPLFKRLRDSPSKSAVQLLTSALKILGTERASACLDRCFTWLLEHEVPALDLVQMAQASGSAEMARRTVESVRDGKADLSETILYGFSRDELVLELECLLELAEIPGDADEIIQAGEQELVASGRFRTPEVDEDEDLLGDDDDTDTDDDHEDDDDSDGDWRWKPDDDPPPPVEPIVRDEPKVGRNDPCPCGSGKKYKKCCGK